MTQVNDKILICTDLDRTLLPNGHAPSSQAELNTFKSFVSHPAITLAYVSGRDKQLVIDAIDQFGIPVPDFAITDVGSSIYQIHSGEWQVLDNWNSHIAPDWAGHHRDELAQHLSRIHEISEQEPHKQGPFKLSYYADININTELVFQKIQDILKKTHINANIIWSVDDISNIGLIDILPKSANKLHAIRFLIQENGFSVGRSIFAGDSGNDIEVLCSEIPSILVANASDTVKQLTISRCKELNMENNFYQASGNYAAGILEGILYYMPELSTFINN